MQWTCQLINTIPGTRVSVCILVCVQYDIPGNIYLRSAEEATARAGGVSIPVSPYVQHIDISSSVDGGVVYVVPPIRLFFCLSLPPRQSISS